MADDDRLQLRALGYYAAYSAVGHLTWEILQLPLYTIWFEGAPSQIAFAVAHCTGGDLLIAGTTALVALAMIGRSGWPSESAVFRKVTIAAIVLAVAYTIFSEWQNVQVRATWAYSSWMPRLPPLGTGLSPVAQWIVTPLISFVWTRRRVRKLEGPHDSLS